MCMIINEKGEVLVQNRVKSDWAGLTFPGGHVENDETLLESVIREVKEETGLIILDAKLVGVYEWPWENNSRYLAFLYKATKFDGNIISSKEGEIFFVKPEDFSKYKLSTDFLEIYNSMCI